MVLLVLVLLLCAALVPVVWASDVVAFGDVYQVVVVALQVLAVFAAYVAGTVVAWGAAFVAGSSFVVEEVLAASEVEVEVGVAYEEDNQEREDNTWGSEA